MLNHWSIHISELPLFAYAENRVCCFSYLSFWIIWGEAGTQLLPFKSRYTKQEMWWSNKISLFRIHFFPSSFWSRRWLASEGVWGRGSRVSSTRVPASSRAATFTHSSLWSPSSLLTKRPEILKHNCPQTQQNYIKTNYKTNWVYCQKWTSLQNFANFYHPVNTHSCCTRYNQLVEMS